VESQRRRLNRLKHEIAKHRASSVGAADRMSDEDFERLFMAIENFLPKMRPDDYQALLKAALRRRLVKIFRESGNHDIT